MEQYSLDTRPYLATAVARNTKAYRAVRKIYYEKIAECEAALKTSPLLNHKYVISCPIETYIKAKQALGVSLISDKNTWYKIIRQGWIGMAQQIEKGSECTKYLASSPNDSVLFDRIVVYIVMMYANGRKPHTEYIDMAINVFKYYEDEITVSIDEAAGKKAFPNKNLTGSAALENCEGGLKLMTLMNALCDRMGFNISDYIASTPLSSANRGMCVSVAGDVTELLSGLGMLSMIVDTIRAERQYLLSPDSEAINAKAAMLQLSLDKANKEIATVNGQKKLVESRLSDIISENERLSMENARLSAQLELFESYKQECAALRETLYRSTEHIIEPEADEKPKHLPDDLRIVCIGGHDRWITTMKTLLPLTYIPADVTPDMAVIRNASAVWFFAEYMSHRQFTPIIECCRTNRVPVYYFSRSGAERCAEEILDQHGII